MRFCLGVDEILCSFSETNLGELLTVLKQHESASY